MEQRSEQIMRASTVNIVGNLILALFKCIVGAVSHSIAIVLDGVNSLTDAIASVITIIGTKLANRPASRNHPFGFGRMEYIATLVISAIILAAGVTSLIESVRAIVFPRAAEYGPRVLTIVAVAAVVKCALGLYLRRMGKRIGADALFASGTDALMDSIVSAATFAAALIFIFTGASIEAWLAAGISLLIIKNGIVLLVDVISKMLGERVDPSLAAGIEREARSVDGVKLVNGVVVQDYGPNRLNGSLYLTVDAQTTVADFDSMAREVRERVAEECGVQLTCIGAYPANSTDADERAMRSAIGRIVWSQDYIAELRGLYVDTEQRAVRFDAVATLGEQDLDALQADIEARCLEAFPGWDIDARIVPDLGD